MSESSIRDAGGPLGVDHSSWERFDTWGPWTAGIVLAAVTLVHPYPPMGDLPMHEVVVAALRHWNEPALFPHTLYRLNFGHPNQLFYFLAVALSSVMSVSSACKTVVAAGLLLLPISARQFARHAGAPTTSVLFIVPLAFGWLFYWGLVTNLLGLVVLLASLPSLDRVSDEPTGPNIGRCLGLLLLLYFAHHSMLLVASALLVEFALLKGESLKGLVRRLIPPALALVGAVAQIRLQAPLLARRQQSDPPTFFPLLQKLVSLPSVLFAHHPDSNWTIPIPRTGDEAALDPWELYPEHGVGLVLLVLVTMALLRRVRFEFDGHRDETLRGRIRGLRWELSGLGCLALYFIAPYSYNGATLLHERFAAPAYCLLILGTARSFSSARDIRVLGLLGLTISAGSIAAAIPEFGTAARLVRNLEALSVHVAPGSPLAYVRLGTLSKGAFPQTPFAAHVTALRGGRSMMDFTMSTISPVILPPDFQWDDTVNRIASNGYHFVPSFDLQNFRYLLVHCSLPGIAPLLNDALAPEAHPVANQGDWYLFESNLAVGPIDRTEPKFPTSPVESLAVRLGRRVRVLPREQRKQWVQSLGPLLTAP